MTTQLQNVVVKEIGLVKRGANNKKFLLTKSADEPETPENKIMADTNQPTPEAVALEKAQADLAATNAKLEALEKAQKVAADKAEALEKALAAEKDAKEVAEAIRKAADNFKNIPAKAEDLGPMLRVIRKMDTKTADVLEDILTKVDAIVKQTLAPQGSARADEKSDNAWAEIKKRADALVSSKTVTSFAKAVDSVLAADKDLYAQHEQEQLAQRSSKR